MAAGALACVIYALCDPDTLEVRYVGKTNDLASRIRCHRWEAQSGKRHTYKANWLRSLDHEPVVMILEEVTLDTWVDAERKWIKYYRGKSANLTNLADGGETSYITGKTMPDETRDKLRELALARGDKPPSRKGELPWNKGTHGVAKGNITSFSKNYVPWNKGKKMSEEQKIKLHLAAVGKPWTTARMIAQENRKISLEVN